MMSGVSLPDTFEFTTTACVRPEVLDRTYKSFSEKIIDVDFKKSRLYINIDLVPNENYDSVLEVANRYFGEVIYNIGDHPNFAKALKWCWSQPKNDCFFHLEDDWEICENKKIKIKEFFHYLTVNRPVDNKRISGLANRKVVAVNLRAYNIKDYRLCLSPSLWDTYWVKKSLKRMPDTENPELRLRSIAKLDHACSIHFPRNTINNRLVYDIGRSWLDKSEYKKTDNRKWTKWKKK